MWQALDVFREIASGDELRLDYWLEPGDLQLLNNHCNLHTRTEFRDHEVRGMEGDGGGVDMSANVYQCVSVIASLCVCVSLSRGSEGGFRIIGALQVVVGGVT